MHVWKRVGMGIAVSIPLLVEALLVDPGACGLWCWRILVLANVALGLGVLGCCGLLGGSPSRKESEIDSYLGGFSFLLSLRV